MARGQTRPRRLADRALDIQAIQLDMQRRNTDLLARLARGERHSLAAYAAWVDRRLSVLLPATAEVCGELNTLAVASAQWKGRNE